MILQALISGGALPLHNAAVEELKGSTCAATASRAVTWRIDHSVRDTTARRQIEALGRLNEFQEKSSLVVFEQLARCVVSAHCTWSIGHVADCYCVGWRHGTTIKLLQPLPAGRFGKCRICIGYRATELEESATSLVAPLCTGANMPPVTLIPPADLGYSIS